MGLERHGHEPGGVLDTRIEDEAGKAILEWASAAPGSAAQLDQHRVTEDAAEAIALALVDSARGWKVRRRLQRGEAADWLLKDTDDVPVALEVSGIGAGRDPRRLREKLEQVSRATFAERRVACVVELPAPAAILRTVNS